MTTCSAIRSNGERCRAWPLNGSEFCLNHEPSRAEDRTRNGRKGNRVAGRGRPTTELKRLQKEFERLAADVEAKRVDRAIGAVAGQLLNGARACVRDTLQAREQEELVGRLERLETALEAANQERLIGRRPA
jgi:hypothetical protein